MSIVEQLRTFWREVTESDGGESGQCRMMREAADEIERLQITLGEWEECAQYDATMEGPLFKGWNRSALDRCRLKMEQSRAKMLSEQSK